MTATAIRLLLSCFLAFAALAAILTTIGVVVVLEVHGMLTSVDRVLEEQREASQARDLLLPSWDTGLEVDEMCVVLEADRALGDVPLAGFYANGEISHNRLYGYTGVLTLFS